MNSPQRRTREKFLPDEDIELRRLVGIYGTSAWEAVARELPSRSVRQCRERWKHYLSGDREKVPWSAEEDRLLFEKMQSTGPKWTRLAAFFPGRTDIEVKSHWMQTFAGMSNLHIWNRTKKPPLFQPTMPPPLAPNTHLQFMQVPPLVPKAPTPHGELDGWLNQGSRDPSFGSRSFFDFTTWD
jgi:hypothetical protein